MVPFSLLGPLIGPSLSWFPRIGANLSQSSELPSHQEPYLSCLLCSCLSPVFGLICRLREGHISQSLPGCALELFCSRARNPQKAEMVRRVCYGVRVGRSELQVLRAAGHIVSAVREKQTQDARGCVGVSACARAHVCVCVLCVHMFVYVCACAHLHA